MRHDQRQRSPQCITVKPFTVKHKEKTLQYVWEKHQLAFRGTTTTTPIRLTADFSSEGKGDTQSRHQNKLPTWNTVSSKNLIYTWIRTFQIRNWKNLPPLVHPYKKYLRMCYTHRRINMMKECEGKKSPRSTKEIQIKQWEYLWKNGRAKSLPFNNDLGHLMV